MMTFYLACAGLVLLSTLFLFLPLRKAHDEVDPERVNLQWFRTRSRELSAEDQSDLVEDARLRLLEDDNQPHLQAADAGVTFSRWLLIPLLAVMAVGFYYRLGGVTDVTIAQRLQAIETGATGEDAGDLMAAIGRRAEQRPDNLHYIALLGRYYMGQSDYGNATQAYEQLLQSVPEDPQILAYAAQARYMAGGRKLDDRARLYAEQALAANPHERTALGLLGMASFEQGQYREAIHYWERLVVMEAPGTDGRAMIEDVLSRARALLGANGDTVATGDTTAGDGVTVSVSLPAGATVSPSDTVFVFARDAASNSRMPIAVQRRSGGELPLSLRLDDSNSMAGRTLSSLAALVVSAQVSPDGAPGEANATWVATSAPVGVGENVQLLLQRNDSVATASGAASAGRQPGATVGPGVTVHVSLPAGASVNPGDSVFVLARNAQTNSRMPIAVQRLTGAQLPLTLRLDDSNSMAGQRISQIASVVVAVQVSPTGQPGEAAASWLGEAGPLAPDTSGDVVPVVLTPN